MIMTICFHNIRHIVEKGRMPLFLTCNLLEQKYKLLKTIIF